MDVIGGVSGLLGAFGLASAAGLNAYIPLLVVGVLARTGYASLGEPYALLASTPVLVVLAVLGLIDFVADKVPAVDHVVHAASQNSVLRDVHPAVALAAGFVLAGGFHATRAALRPVATTTTAGLGNPALSLAEDVTSAVLSVLAFVAPLLVLALLLVLVYGAVRAWKAIRAGLRYNRAGKTP
jgi:hypothetical protein